MRTGHLTKHIPVVVVLICLFAVAGFAFPGGEKPMDREALERKVRSIVEQPNVSVRRDVAYIYQLADLYYEEGRKKEALDLYQNALTVDSLNFPYQLRAARMLMDTGDETQAWVKAVSVYRLAEDTALIRKAGELLAEMGRTPALSGEAGAVKDSPVEIVLVPMGFVNPYLLEELKRELEPRTGVRISIANTVIPLGEIDRPYYSRRKAKPSFLSLLLNPRASKEGQYNADRLMERVSEEFRSKVGTRDRNGALIMGFLGITGEDMYARDYNFLFGWAGKPYGVMSYARFTAKFNHELPNRPRLLDRTLKQALSSTSLILGIPRCSTPDCARAYPHTLDEHDAKSTELCDICKGRLKAYIESVRRNCVQP